MTEHLYPPIHHPPRPSEAPEGVHHRFLVLLEGYYRRDDPTCGELWSYKVYDREYEQGRLPCYAVGNFHSDLDAVQAAEFYCGEGEGRRIRYTYRCQGALRVARRRAGLPA